MGIDRSDGGFHSFFGNKVHDIGRLGRFGGEELHADPKSAFPSNLSRKIKLFFEKEFYFDDIPGMEEPGGMEKTTPFTQTGEEGRFVVKEGFAVDFHSGGTPRHRRDLDFMDQVNKADDLVFVLRFEADAVLALGR